MFVQLGAFECVKIFSVMRGLVPRIHVSFGSLGVGGRDKPGHDEQGISGSTWCWERRPSPAPPGSD